MNYIRNRYFHEDGTYYQYEPLDYGFPPQLESDDEKFNLIGLILRDYADTLHTKEDQDSRNFEAHARALAAWCDDQIG